MKGVVPPTMAPMDSVWKVEKKGAGTREEEPEVEVEEAPLGQTKCQLTLLASMKKIGLVKQERDW